MLHRHSEARMRNTWSSKSMTRFVAQLAVNFELLRERAPFKGMSIDLGFSRNVRGSLPLRTSVLHSSSCISPVFNV